MEKGLGSPEGAQRISDEYPIGKTVVVHYNPDKPNDAVLEPRYEKWLYLVVAGGLLFVVIGVCIGLGWFGEGRSY